MEEGEVEHLIITTDSIITKRNKTGIEEEVIKEEIEAEEEKEEEEEIKEETEVDIEIKTITMMMITMVIVEGIATITTDTIIVTMIDTIIIKMRDTTILAMRDIQTIGKMIHFHVNHLSIKATIKVITPKTTDNRQIIIQLRMMTLNIDMV